MSAPQSTSILKRAPTQTSPGNGSLSLFKILVMTKLGLVNTARVNTKGSVVIIVFLIRTFSPTFPVSDNKKLVRITRPRVPQNSCQRMDDNPPLSRPFLRKKTFPFE